MKTKIAILALALASIVGVLRAESGPSKKDAAALALPSTTDTSALRVLGEQRYRANCGRCHAAPRKFPPRMMATVLRHMRVRATITDEDMRLVLLYMTQ